MGLKYLMPQKEYSWEELDKLTAKKEGLWTWPLAALIRLRSMGFEVVNIERFDYDRFGKEGEAYLYEFYGDEVGMAQSQHSDLPHEQQWAKAFTKNVSTQTRSPTIDDIKKFVQNGWVVITNINARKLNQKRGYAGHFVVIVGYDEDKIIIHDPGLPPLENRAVPVETFERAWAYPESYVKNLMAFR